MPQPIRLNTPFVDYGFGVFGEHIVDHGGSLQRASPMTLSAPGRKRDAVLQAYTVPPTGIGAARGTFHAADNVSLIRPTRA